jgi:hypothetical protein
MLGREATRDYSLFNRFQLNHRKLTATRVRKADCELPKSERPRGAFVSAIRTLDAKSYFSGHAVLNSPRTCRWPSEQCVQSTGRKANLRQGEQSLDLT